MFRTSQSSKRVQHDKSRAVVLDDLSVRKYAHTVRRIFFPVWPQHKDWSFILEPGNSWAWACDYDRQAIIVSRHRYPEKDLLRTALIVQIAHARTGINSAEAWFAELDRVRSIAESLGRERIVCYLGEIMKQASMNVLDIRHVDGANRLETHVTEVALTDSENPKASMDSVSTFQDSLQLGYMERQLDQASLALRRLGLK